MFYKTVIYFCSNSLAPEVVLEEVELFSESSPLLLVVEAGLGSLEYKPPPFINALFFESFELVMLAKASFKYIPPPYVAIYKKNKYLKKINLCKGNLPLLF